MYLKKQDSIPLLASAQKSIKIKELQFAPDKLKWFCRKCKAHCCSLRGRGSLVEKTDNNALIAIYF